MKHWHPLTLLLIWLAALLWLQRWPLPWLAMATSCLLCLAVLGAGAQLRPLLRRTRWLMLATALIFVWATPGEWIPLLPGASYEGLAEGLSHLLALLLFVAALALLLARLQLDGLVTALYAACRPLAWCGLDRDRAAVRLLLVLNYLEQPLPPGGWRHLLDSATLPAERNVSALNLPQADWRWHDLAAIATLILLWGWLT